MFIIFYGFQKYPKSKVFSPKTSARAFTLQKVEKGAFNISLDFSLLKSASTALTLILSNLSCLQGKIVSVHCREEGCIGKYIPRGPRDFPRAGILHPEAREIARGQSQGPFISPYSYCFDILLACNMTTISFFASLLEHC